MKEYFTLSKHKEPDGPWKKEPDLVTWTDLETGYECHIKRHPQNGSWCGYVGASALNELERARDLLSIAQAKFDSIMEMIEVHGGITYEGNIEEEKKEYGFDCGHFYDVMPFRAREINEDNATYRDKDYAINECKKLALQFKKLEIKGE